MPLPDLAPNNTIRAWLKYSSLGNEHELCFRQPAGTIAADVAANATALAQAFVALVPTGEFFTSLRWSQAGSNLSFPVSFTAVAGTGAIATEADDPAKFMSVVGRSSSGYRCRMTLFCPYIQDSIGYRQGRGAGNLADIMLDAVDAMEPDPVAIDGKTVIWNQYINIGYNAYWQRQLR